MLTFIGTSPAGNDIFVRVTEHGREYFTSSSGCGHSIWDTAITDKEDIEYVLDAEKALNELKERQTTYDDTARD